MTGVMRPRGQFVNDQTSVGEHEEFGAKHSDVIKLLNNLRSDFTRALCDFFIQTSRHDGNCQNAVAVVVFGNREYGYFSLVVACGNHGDFFKERQTLF